MAITDLVTCAFDFLTISGDVGGDLPCICKSSILSYSGNLVVWTKSMKGVAKKISTKSGMMLISHL